MNEARSVKGSTTKPLAIGLALACLFFAGSAGAGQDQEGPALGTPQQKLSYALGMVLGNQFRDQGIEVDVEVYVRGLEDALSGGATRLTPAEARAAVNRLQGGLKRSPALPATETPSEIAVSFKLDPRLTRGMYMGDRWVSPPTYTRVQSGDALVVEARAETQNTSGQKGAASPTWASGNTAVLKVSPSTGRDVLLTVVGEGRTDLTLNEGDVSKALSVEVVRQEGVLRVDISQ